MSYIDKIKATNGTAYDIKDSVSGYQTAQQVQDAIEQAVVGTISAMKRTGVATGAKPLSTSPQQVNLSQTPLNVGGLFDEYANGIKCTKTGLVHITAKIRVGTGFTANDYINAQVYNNTSATVLLTGRIRTPFQTYNSDIVIDGYASVTANDVLIIRAYNEQGSRGDITYSPTSMTVAYVNVGTSGGGASDFSELSFDPSDYTYSIMPEEWAGPLLDTVTDSVSFIDWLFNVLGDISSRLP